MVAFSNGNPIFKNAKGELFSVDATTGDLNFISAEEFSTYKLRGSVTQKGRGDKFSSGFIKLASEDVQDVKVLGVDNQGHTVQQNSRGENFYVNPITGDLIFVKI